MRIIRSEFWHYCGFRKWGEYPNVQSEALLHGLYVSVDLDPVLLRWQCPVWVIFFHPTLYQAAVLRFDLT